MSTDRAAPGARRGRADGVVVSASAYDYPDALFTRRVLDGDFPFLRKAKWQTGTADLSGIRDVLLMQEESEHHTFSAYFERGGVVGLVEIARGECQVQLAGGAQTEVAEALGWLHELLPPIERTEDEVGVRFWMSGDQGPYSISRTITAPSWVSISANYGARTAPALERLLLRPEPARGGQLLLWHGPPGTGKTYAIRALIREWRDWCSAEYVIDPERFFGDRATYMMQVLTGSEDEDGDDDTEKWRLLLFEDAAELLSADARERSGQGLSRLLNTVDGLIGQGLRVLLLITTNEELGKVHPAVARPGRAAANIRFELLEPAEAATWARGHNVQLPSGSRRYSVADLFALAEGFGEPSSAQPIGFRTPTGS